MKVWIDGQERREFSPSAAPLEVLAAVKAEAARSGLVLTELRVDGQEMDEEAFLGLSGGMSAHFTLTPVRILVRESLTEAQAYISRLTKGLEEIAVHFEEGNIASAQGGLSEALEGLDWSLGVYERCRALTAVPVTEAEEQAFREGLLITLNRLIELMGEKKFPQMASVLRQELPPRISTLALLLDRLSEARSRPQ